jgi:hypothetical protein
METIVLLFRNVEYYEIFLLLFLPYFHLSHHPDSQLIQYLHIEVIINCVDLQLPNNYCLSASFQNFGYDVCQFPLFNAIEELS